MEAIDDDPALETGALVAVTQTENIPTQYPPEVLINRQVTESVQSTFSYLTSTLEYPTEYVVDVLARPTYWVPDAQITVCHYCSTSFKPSQSKHHCRACGHGFCDECSQARLPVPSRGWDYPVRVCKQCALKKSALWYSLGVVIIHIFLHLVYSSCTFVLFVILETQSQSSLA